MNSNAISFRHHLATAAPSHPFARDFAHDALDDPEMPEPASWPELRAYLRQCGACRHAVVGAMLAWRSYRATRREGGQKSLATAHPKTGGCRRHKS